VVASSTSTSKNESTPAQGHRSAPMRDERALTTLNPLMSSSGCDEEFRCVLTLALVVEPHPVFA
jgi:hypothetical protein